MVIARTLAPCSEAVRAAVTTRLVEPEPEAATSTSPAPIAGAVVSPTTWVALPRCMKRIAAICNASPLRPVPMVNTAGASTSNAPARSQLAASTPWRTLACSPMIRSAASPNCAAFSPWVSEVDADN